MESYIVGIRFQKVGKIYHFDASDYRDLGVGDFAVVETSRGRQLGEVVTIIENPISLPDSTWKPIHHIATPRDLLLRQVWQKKELEALIKCRTTASEIGIKGVQFVAAEYAFDGTRLSFMYSTKVEGKVDIRRLRNAMKRSFPNTLINFRQIGPRDVARIVGGMGACGLEKRCCSMFLKEFGPISIKMAKAQAVSLSPTEITGMCGRLRCCLVYEYQQYLDARKKLPRCKTKVVTPLGDGTVTDIYPLKETVVVELESGIRHEFPHQDIHPWEEFKALQKKAQEQCSNHKGDSGECGKPSTRNDNKPRSRQTYRKSRKKK
ncbi:stage 0 sporulation family protein [Chloroflexota bacterium]